MKAAQAVAAQYATRENADLLLIFVQALAVIAAILFGIWETHRHIVSRWMSVVPLSLAVSCLLFQLILALVALACSGGLKKREQRLLRRSGHIRPLIRQRLAAFCLQQKGEAELVRLRWRYPADFEVCITEFLQSTGGQAGRHLSRLAETCGLVALWKQKANSGDVSRSLAIESLGLLSAEVAQPPLEELTGHRSPLVRAAALRALVRLTTNTSGVIAVFRHVISSPRLIRAMLAGELRLHASALSEIGMAQALADAQPHALLAALEMMGSWRYGLPLKDLATLAQHDDSRVRAAAIRLISFDLTTAGSNDAWARLNLRLSRSNTNSLVPTILRALQDGDPAVRTAAMDAAARLNIRAAVPAITRGAESQDPTVSSMACLALATMGGQGHAVLESKVRGANSLVAGAATESLAHAKLSPGAVLVGDD